MNTKLHCLCFLAIFAFLQLSVAQDTPQQGNINPESSTETSTTTTTASPRFRSCFANCRTVSHYNPVCGSNGVTYDNEQRLNCAQRCGLDVQLVRGGTCAPLR
ncbi:uncharacterized protein LOC115881318 [Sitophilus oryzae]|uniref:Uncharacterized protein LOC115881318 n=1 Tax=Sitophilus oryzae TaxID=7048 RepID=A0A6J2XSX6_SITOR|nr:uncharacterized protein LOC115881318 [Sitophilus oryzae]